MKKIILVAESGADIPPEIAEQYGIHVVPMHVAFGDTSRDDGSFLSEEICNYYKKTRTLPKTSACSPEDFIRTFDEIHRCYPDAHILHLAYSAVTTCSYQNAQLAMDGRDYVTSVDTKFASVGQGVIVMRMAQLLEKHPEWTVDDAIAAAKDLVTRGRMCFLPGSMEYLRAGGRVSNAGALCGKLLGIRPLIEFKDGHLMATKKLRGRMARLVPQLVGDYAATQSLDKDAIWLSWSTSLPRDLKESAEQAVRASGFRKLLWIKAGGVITTHCGPGAFGIVGFSMA